MRARFLAAAAPLILLGGVAIGAVPARATTPNVLLVGTYNGYNGPYSTIQAAVDAAQPGDWILVGPGDYHERSDYANSSYDSGVTIHTPDVHLRGMNRNTVIVDGTKPTAATPCSGKASDQDLGPVPSGSNSPQGRNGVEVAGQTGGADGVSIENLTVCNFITNDGGENGNQIWWNGGDGGGVINLHGYTGQYLTATSTYSNGVNYPAGSYGIFSSDSTGYGPGHFSLWQHNYASNMSDSSYYIGACQQRCDVVMTRNIGEVSALCLSSTNAGGYLLVEHNDCDNNKTGLVSNAQNNDDWPSPQLGSCDIGVAGEPQTGATGTTSCTVWRFNHLWNNNNPNVPGNGTSGLAGGGPVGTGLILAGSRDVTLYRNHISNNKSWGELIVDLPDPEAAPSQVPQQCQGGTYIPPPAGPLCYYEALGNVSLENVFKNNGGYGNPSNGDIGLATKANNPGNCFAGDSDVTTPTSTVTSDPPGIEDDPLYAPSGGLCNQPNTGDLAVTGAEGLCASNLLVPCSTQLQQLCDMGLQPYCEQAPVANYPSPTKLRLRMPPATKTPTMPDPCAGVPANPFCSAPLSQTPDLPSALAAPATGGAVVLGGWGLGSLRRRRLH